MEKHVIILCILNFSLVRGFVVEKLPENRYEAVEMIREEELDPVLWDLVKKYYTSPLSVPDGELKELAELFPESVDEIPEGEELERYSPWSSCEIQDFFSDYPELISFRPILSFTYSQFDGIGSIAFKIRKTFWETRSYGYTLFDTDISNVSSVKGNLKVTDTAAVWRRRRIELHIKRIRADIEAGNFTHSFNRGLCYGYFPNRSPLSKNWIYSTFPGCNGFKLSQEVVESSLKYTGLYHAGVDNRLLGIIAELSLNKIDLSAGVSHIQSEGDSLPESEEVDDNEINLIGLQQKTEQKKGADSALYIHTKAEFSGDKSDIRCDAAFRYREIRDPVFYIATDTRPCRERKIRLEAVRLPHNSVTEYSRLRRKAERVLSSANRIEGMGGSAIEVEDINYIKARFRREFNHLLNYSMQIQYALSESYSSLEARMGLNGETPLSRELEKRDSLPEFCYYGWCAFNPGYAGSFKNRFKLRLSLINLRIFLGDLSLEQEYYGRFYEHSNSHRIKLSAELSVSGKGIEISPFAEYAIDCEYEKGGDEAETNYWYIYAGTTSTMSITERAKSMIRLEIPFVGDSRETLKDSGYEFDTIVKGMKIYADVSLSF